jgi:hypothetical protein
MQRNAQQPQQQRAAAAVSCSGRSMKRHRAPNLTLNNKEVHRQQLPALAACQQLAAAARFRSTRCNCCVLHLQLLLQLAHLLLLLLLT